MGGNRVHNFSSLLKNLCTFKIPVELIPQINQKLTWICFLFSFFVCFHYNYLGSNVKRLSNGRFYIPRCIQSQLMMVIMHEMN